MTAIVQQRRQRGRRGIQKLDEVFARRSSGAPVSASELEERLLEVIGTAGLTWAAIGQYPLPGEGLVGLVDVAFPPARLVVEADGRRWHNQEQDMERDRERDNQAAARGWQTMRFMHRHLVTDPARVAAQVRATFDRRLRQLGGAA